MKRTSLLLALILLLNLSLTSCGVMFGGSRYNAEIVAKDLPNAEIYVNGEKKGKGQVSGTYYRNQPLKVEIKNEGCKDYKKTYEKRFRTGNFILSLLTWGIVGIGIDLGTGASYKPDHKNDDDITKDGDKNFKFVVEHSDCSEKNL